MAIDFEKEVQYYLDSKDNITMMTELLNDNEKDKLLDEINRKSEEIERLKLEIRINKDGEKNIISALIAVLDSIQWFCKVAGLLSNDAISITINNTKKKIKNIITPIGLIEINEVDDIFNYNLHNCVDVKKDIKKDNNLIDEVLRSGYIYKGKIIRTADVIVVKND